MSRKIIQNKMHVTENFGRKSQKKNQFKIIKGTAYYQLGNEL